MKKTTTQKFSKRLAKYGALSVAIAGVAETNGQIVYTDIADVGGAGAFYALDINNDATIDFAIRQFNSATTTSLGSPGSGFYNILACAPYSSIANYSNAILGNSGAFVYPFALSFGAAINSGQIAWNIDGFQTMNYNSCVYGGDFWCPGIGDAYLGLKFKLINGPGPGDDTIHYGWARIGIGAIASDWLIKDYAYNSTPNAPINAGQTVLGIDDNVFSKIKVVALNKSIRLYNLPETARYNIYSMTGQEVLKGTTDNRDYVIEAPTLASGVYVLELTDSNSKGVIRKKVVLQ